MVDVQLPVGHFEALLKKMNQDRLEGRFCDVQLTVNSRHIPVHRCVLAASSPYFSGMFSGNFLETDKGMTTIDLSDSIAEIVYLETVLTALYTGHLSLDRGNVGPVTQLVSFLMVDSLKDLCVQFLLSDIQLQTSVNYFVLGDLYDIDEVESYCFAMLESRFHDYFIYQEEILQVSSRHLNLLFQRSIHRYCDSVQILQLLFSWAMYKDVAERVPTATCLFHSMCVGLDTHGLCEMQAWLESHKGDNTSVIAEFTTIVQSVIGNQVITYDADKTPESDTSPATKEDTFHATSTSQNLDAGNMLTPGDTMSHPLTPTTSFLDFSTSDSMMRSSSKDSLSSSECLVVLSPTCEVVKSVLAIEVEEKIILSSISLDISFYKPEQKIWLNFGQVTFPGVFDDKNSWRTSCGHERLYFLSAVCDVGYCLNLKTRSWVNIDCRVVLKGLQGDVRSLIPLVVDGFLFVLASNRLISESRDYYQTEQRYYRLMDDLTWQSVGEVSHEHYSTPLSLISVSESIIYVIKADIAINVAKNLLIIKEGHMFDTRTNKVEKFSAISYVPSPVRVMVKDRIIYILDGEGWLRSYNKDKSQWEFPTQVDLSDVRWCRASTIDGHFPCMSHVSTGAGGCVWEMTSFRQNATALLEVEVGKETGLNTKIHIPPPYKYFAMAAAGRIHNSVLSSLHRSRFLHV